MANRDRLQGRMGTKGHYIIQKGSALEGHRGPKEIVYGNIMDVVAYMVEQGRFFGEWVGTSPEQATNPNNARIEPAMQGDTIEGLELQINSIEGGRLCADVACIDERQYLDPLRSREGYRTALSVIRYDRALDDAITGLWS
jgi:hypothetical protein